MPLKNGESEQLGRVTADPLADAPADQIPAPSGNFAKAPLVDVYGRLIVVVQSSASPVMPTTPPNVFSSADAAGLPALITAGAAPLLHVYGFSPSKDAFLMLFDLAAVPADGVTPDITLAFKSNDNTTAIYDVQSLGDPFSLGIVVAFSSDPYTLATPPQGTSDEYRIRILWK